MNTTTVATLVQPYSLLPLDDTSVFPSRFDSNMHPIIFTLASLATKDNSTEKLYTASIFVPFVDRLSDGQTNFTFPIRCLVGGLDVKH